MPRIGRLIAIIAINRVAPDENVRPDMSLSPAFYELTLSSSPSRTSV